jgi:hypothetical protein
LPQTLIFIHLTLNLKKQVKFFVMVML